jgi:hypothetical protein
MARSMRASVFTVAGWFMLLLAPVTAATAQDSSCVQCTIPIDCPIISSANACACEIQAFHFVRICREKGYCDEGCGEPLPDLPAKALIDRSSIDKAKIDRTAIDKLFAKEPLLALVIAGSFSHEKGGLFLDLEPYNGGTFEYSGVPYTHEGQFKKLAEDRVQFRFVLREKRANGAQITFVGELLEKGRSVNYSRIRVDANGNPIDRTHTSWTAPDR